MILIFSKHCSHVNFFEDLEFDLEIEVFNFDFDLELNFQGETHVSVIKNHECRY